MWLLKTITDNTYRSITSFYYPPQVDENIVQDDSYE